MTNPKASVAAVLPLLVSTSAVALLPGCVISETRTPAPVDYQARTVREVGRWDVLAGGAAIGQLVKLSIEDRTGPIEFFRVVNERREWVGHVTPAGRFSRRVPFQEQDEILGVYGMKEGLGLLFDTRASIDLEEAVQDGAVEATARRSR